jgi:uncharacterized protein YdaU (DUF1376 family)
MSAADGMMIWTGDYMADTRHFSTTQHGAYLLILMTMWRNGGSLPYDEKRLAKIAGVTPIVWRSIGPEIMELLTVEGSVVTQKRLAVEFSKTLAKINQSKSAGHASAKAKSLKKQESESTIVETPLQRDDESVVTNGLRLRIREEKEESARQGATPTALPEGKPKGKKKAALGTRLEPNWKPSKADIDSAKGYGLSDRDIDWEAQKFVNYWTSKTGSGGTKLDWPATWRNWCMRTAETKGFAPKAATPKIASVRPKDGDVLDSRHTSIAKHYGLVYFHRDSPQYRAWEDHFRGKGPSVPDHLHNGWSFPEPWPPGYVHVPKQVNPSQPSSGGNGAAPGVMQLKLVTNEGKVADGFNQ